MFDEDDIGEFLVVCFLSFDWILVSLMQMVRRHRHASLLLLPTTLLSEDGDFCYFLRA